MRQPPLTDTKGVASWNFKILTSLCNVIIKSPWEDLSSEATSLLEKKISPITETFILRKEGQFTFKHVTSIENPTSYFEDHVFYLDFLFNYYQLQGKEETKHEIINLVKFVNNSFLKDNKMYQRSLKQDLLTPLPNNEVPIFDQSFCSPAAKYLNLLRKIHFLEPDENLKDLVTNLQENVKGIILRNPINSGEALKAFTYPWEAYFSVRVPVSYLTDELFIKIRRYAPARLLFNYSEKDDNWQICSDKECKDSGSGLINLSLIHI